MMSLASVIDEIEQEAGLKVKRFSSGTVKLSYGKQTLVAFAAIEKNADEKIAALLLQGAAQLYLQTKTFAWKQRVHRGFSFHFNAVKHGALVRHLFTSHLTPAAAFAALLSAHHYNVVGEITPQLRKFFSTIPAAPDFSKLDFNTTAQWLLPMNAYGEVHFIRSSDFLTLTKICNFLSSKSEKTFASYPEEPVWIDKTNDELRNIALLIAHKAKVLQLEKALKPLTAAQGRRFLKFYFIPATRPLVEFQQQRLLAGVKIHAEEATPRGAGFTRLMNHVLTEDEKQELAQECLQRPSFDTLIRGLAHAPEEAITAVYAAYVLAGPKTVEAVLAEMIGVPEDPWHTWHAKWRGGKTTQRFLAAVEMSRTTNPSWALAFHGFNV